MNDEHPDARLPDEERWEDVSAQLAANRADIDALEARADAANHRASATEDTTAEHNRRLDKLEVSTDLDHKLIEELQAEGILAKEHVAHMAEALRSSRKIGAAIGIVMANRKVSESAAFDVLKETSQHDNRKVRVVAEELVETGDVSGLRSA